jgi:hypothetical protein
MDGSPSPHLEQVTSALEQAGHAVTELKVPYEFQLGGNTMLQVGGENG